MSKKTKHSPPFGGGAYGVAGMRWTEDKGWHNIDTGPPMNQLTDPLPFQHSPPPLTSPEPDDEEPRDERMELTREYAIASNHHRSYTRLVKMFEEKLDVALEEFQSGHEWSSENATDLIFLQNARRGLVEAQVDLDRTCSKMVGVDNILSEPSTHPKRDAYADEVDMSAWRFTTAVEAYGLPKEYVEPSKPPKDVQSVLDSLRSKFKW